MYTAVTVVEHVDVQLFEFSYVRHAWSLLLNPVNVGFYRISVLNLTASVTRGQLAEVVFVNLLY
jgi:hypothetical protein